MKRIMLKLYDYENKVVKTPVNLCDTNVKKVTIDVMSGDEVATVEYYDGTKKVYDSSDCRTTDFHDNRYVLLDRENDIDIIEDFLNREDSYTL